MTSDGQTEPVEAPRRRGLRTVLVIAAAALALAALGFGLLSKSAHRLAGSGGQGAQAPGAALAPCGAQCAPIDPAQLTDLHFSNTSFWLQPWRAYLDTWPAARLQDALGINFNAHAGEAQSVARILHEAGFRLARIGLSWGSLEYSDPSRFTEEQGVRERLEALKRYSLRPLIVLDANSEAPCPHEKILLEATQGAPQGATTIQLSPASAAQVAPGRTGLASANFNKGLVIPRRELHRLSREQRRALRLLHKRERRERHLNALVVTGNPAILITAVTPSGLATLSRPLPNALEAGTVRATKLLYAPFPAPKLPDGSPNPAFQHTLSGWLDYVKTVSHLAASIFGPGGFDLEVWNELSFGSQFLQAAKYYETPPEGEGRQSRREAIKAILRASVEWVRSPASGLSSEVGVSNGFASETPFATGQDSPVGLTAISKHPYSGPKVYPEDVRVRPGWIPLNALGERDTVGPRGSPQQFTASFKPQMRTLYPEVYMTAETPDTLIRDLAPFKTHIYEAQHGRYVHSEAGRPVQVWITEYNLGYKHGEVTGPGSSEPLSGAYFGPGDAEHFQAKVLLRSLVSWVAKGVAREYFFAAVRAGDLGIIPHGWSGGTLAQGGGEALHAMARLTAAFGGPGPGAAARQLSLRSIVQHGTHAQFQGQGTAAHPSLLDREVLAVLPFQSAPGRFVIPFYVMTRNLKTDYRPSAPASERSRFDLPSETFEVTLANLPSGDPKVSAYDPLTGTSSPASLVRSSGSSATFRVAASDYPRLLELQYP